MPTCVVRAARTGEASQLHIDLDPSGYQQSEELERLLMLGHM